MGGRPGHANVVHGRLNTVHIERDAMARLALIVLACALLGCATTAPQLAGAWRIEDVDGGGVIDSSRLEITFAPDGGVSGQSGCNAFTGRYTQNGASVDIGPLASTRRACAEALMLQEARVLQALDAVTTASLEADGALVLTGAAPARLLLRRMDETATARIAVSGEIYFLERIALPPNAVVRVTAEDVARVDAPATMLARVETPATAGPPFAFALEIPRDQLAPHARVAVRAQILSGYAILFTSTEHHGVALDGAPAPMRIRVFPVEAASGAGGHPVTPPQQTYVCGGERLRIAFEEGAAFVTLEGGESLRLDRLRAQGGDDPEAPRLFSNGRVTLRLETEGTSGPIVSFARGRAAFVTCQRA